MIHSAKRPWIVIVGGFLGAGKTTLLLAAAGVLRMRGMRPAFLPRGRGRQYLLSVFRCAGLRTFEAPR